MGGITEIATSAPGYSCVRPEHRGTARRDAEAQRLLDRAVRQVPRGSGVARPARWGRSTAGRPAGRVRALLRVHRRRDEPVLPGDLRGHRAGRAGPHARGGLPLHRGHDRPRDRVGAPAEGADARQAVLHVLRARRHPRSAPRADRVVGRATAVGSTRAGTRCASRRFARQKELGVVPPDAELTARPAEIPAWDDMPDELKPVLARQMEVYAGFLEHTDHHVGRLIDTLEELGILDDTLVYVHHRRQRRVGRGHRQRHLQRDARPQRRSRLRDDGVHGVADRRVRHARRRTTTTRSGGRTRWTRRTSGRSRSRRTGAAPATARSCTGRGIDARGEIRDQFHHVIDVAPTVLEAAGLPAADLRERCAADAAATASAWRTRSTTPMRPSGTTTQYFEMFCNRGIYHQGWTAVTRHSIPWR